jgi:phenylpyruvate tautomerase PptA (4-oxalocrotonate tautomerase family)
MPILEVIIVLKEDESLPPGLAAELADAAAAVFDSGPGQTWVRLESVGAAEYAENGGGPPAGVSPVFIRVLKAQLTDREQMRREAERLTAAIAAAVRRPIEHVHLVYEPPGRGRVSFGGRLLTE